MRISGTNLEGLMILNIDVKNDERGFFLKPYSSVELEGVSLIKSIAEVFYSVSRVDVLRGMHFQIPPFAQKKIVGVINGAILDVVIDIRKNSETYGEYASFNMSANDGQFLFIPDGFAHGFLSLSEDTTVIYIVDNLYSKPHEDGIRYDSFGFDWPIRDPIISDKDSGFIAFKDFDSPF